MLYSAKSLLDLKPADNGVNHKPIKVSEDHSFFIEALDLIQKNNEEMRNMLNDILSEAYFSDLADKVKNSKILYNRRFSFGSVIGFIFQLFLKALDQLWLRFKALFLRLLDSDGSIKHYAPALGSFDEELKTYIPYYIYTNLDIDIPNGLLKYVFNEEYDDLYDKLQTISKLDTKDKMIDGLHQIYQQVVQQLETGNYYNKMRGKIMGKTDGTIITEESFQKQLYRLFRNNMDEPYKGNTYMPSYEVRNALTRFMNYKQNKKTLEKDISSTKSTAKQVESKMKKIKAEDIFEQYKPIDYEIEHALNQVLQLKSGQVQKVCDLIVMAYSAKLDALKEAIIQDRRILQAAISQIIIKEMPNE